MKKQLHNLSLKTLMFVMLSMAFIINGTPTQAQYCTPPHTSATPCISSVVFATINNATPTTCAVPSYTNYPTSAFTAVLTKGMTYNMNVVSTGTSANKVSVWIDYNQNQVYEASEWTRVYDVGQSGNVNITIPPTALSGNTGMRIRVRLASSPNEATDACTSFGGGESEDYTVTIIDAFPCTAPPTPGVTTASSTFICPNTTFNLGLQGNQFGSGLSYQWQSSPDSIAWTNMTGFTSLTATAQVTSAPMYYRCELICSSVPAYSTPVKVRPRSLLPGGTYTLNASLPNSSTNFNSFAEFNSAINCGISGPIVLNVTPGTYVGTLSLVNLSGTSSINTVTINGHGAKLIDTLKTGKPDYILQIRGTNYVTVDSMILEAHSSSSKPYFVVSMGEANYNTIKNSKIIGDQLNTTTTYVGLCVSGSTTSYSVATTAKYNTFENNDISGGYFAMVLYGSTTIANMKGNIIRNNTVRDFYYYGVYLIGTDSAQIVGNDIHRKNKLVASATTAGIYSLTAGQQMLVKGNRIHDMNATGTFYGIYHSANDGIVGKENIIANNAIYDNSIGGQYSIYNSSSDHCKYYYNTVYVNNNDASSTGLSYGFYQVTLATGIELKNNIFSINKAGSGAKYCLYFSTATTLPNTDYNDLYVNTSAAGTGVKNIAYHSAARVTLADWKAYTSNAYDQNSVDVEPLIAGAAFDNLKPNAAALNNSGTTIASVVDDITGAIRSSTPDIGAYEFTPANDDAGISAIVSPVEICPGLANVEVRVKNYGISTMSSVTVNWSVNGVAQTPYVFIGSVNSGADTLLGIGSFNVIANTPYNLKIWTSAPNGNIDANSINDTIVKNGLKTGFLGTYTIGGVGANFPTLTAAAAELNANGVCGPVVFNVNPAAGPYIGQLNIGIIKGASATNTVTFKGNGAEIRHISNNTSSRHVVLLDQSKYVTIDSFVLTGYRGPSTTNYAWGVHLTSGSSYNTIKNNKIYVSDSTTSTNFAGIVLSGSTSSATTAGVFSYNKIENNEVNGGYYGIIMYGASGTAATARGNVVKGNTVKNVYYYTLYLYYHDSTMVYGNRLSSNTRPVVSTTHYAMYTVGLSNKTEIVGNKIFDYFGNAATTAVTFYGIYTSTSDNTVGNEVLIANNDIYNIGGNGTLYGIYNTGSDGHLYYHNTVVLDNKTSTTGVTHGIYQTTLATGIEIKNNNFVLTRAGVGALVGINLATNTSTISSNFNNIYITRGATGAWGTTNYGTLSNWMTANSNAFDQNSISLDPLLNGYRNSIPQVGTPLANAGTALPRVPTDLLGNPRNSATPFIGAYEITGDFSGPTMTGGLISNTTSTANFVLTGILEATDAAGVDNTVGGKPRLYYKKTTHDNTILDNTSATNGWKYVEANNSTTPYDFTIDYSKLFGGTVAVNDEFNYFFVAKDLLGNVSSYLGDLVGDITSTQLNAGNFPATTTNTYRIGSGISGTILVGTGKTYTSLTGTAGVFSYLNGNVVNGNIDIVITSNLTETGAVGLNQITETGVGNYNITIKPLGDTLRTLTGSYTGGLIRLNGADRVSIDGSGTNNGRYLKIQNNATATNVAAIQLISLGAGLGATNNTIKNCEIISGTGANSIGIHMGGPTIPYSPGGANNNNKILNNIIYRGSVGIFSGGSDVDGVTDSLIIVGNTLGSDVTADNLRLYGMALEVSKNSRVENNIIKNIINTAAQQAWGIALYDGFTNGIIRKNKIDNISSGSGAFAGRGIELISNKSNENIVIDNNFISNTKGIGSNNLASTANVGISIRATRGVKVYYNSINMPNGISALTSGTSDRSAALHIGTNSGSLEILNNNLVNTTRNVNDTSYAYAFYSEVSDTAFTAFNNNNFYVTQNYQGVLGYVVGAGDLTSLSAITAATAGKNTNSISLKPNYVSNSNLHSFGVNMLAKGTPIVGLTTDIDGDTRSTTLPCIGADEFVTPPVDLKLVEVLYPTDYYCGTTTDSVKLVVENLGTATQNNITINVQLTKAVTANLSRVYTRAIAPGAIDTISVGVYNANISDTLLIRAIVSVAGDANANNDTVRTSRILFATPVPPTFVSSGSACLGSSATVVVSSSASTIAWYDAASGGNLLTKNDTLLTPPLTGSTTFYAEATNSTIQNFTLGLPATLAPTSGAGTTNFGIVFDVHAPALLKAVTVYPIASSAGVAGTVTIDVVDAANVVIHTATVNVIGNPAASATAQEVTLNFNLLPGTNYKIRPGARSTGITGLHFEPSASAPGGNYGYPMVLPGFITLVTSTLTAPPTNTARNDLYYYFYNWKVSAGQDGCPSDRVAVTVVPTSGPAGSGVAQSTPFDGVFNAGTLANADGACVGDVLTYSLVPPTGFNLAGLGTTWNIINPTIKTLNGATPVGAVTMSGISLQYTASAGDKDSTLVFTAKIRNLSTGCDTLISRYLNVSGTPSVSLGTDQNICEGTVLTLDAGTASSYLWSTGATTQTIQVTTAGTYTVEIKNASGCEARDTIVVTTTTTPTANLGPDASSCVGTPITLDAGNPGSTYLWNTGATTQTIQANASGIYIVTVTGNGGCFDTDTIQLNFNALPVVSIGADAEICTSDTLTLDAGNVGSTYLWSTGATTQTIRVSDAGTYSVTVTNGNGCVNNDAIVITNKAVPVSSYSIVSSTGQSITFQATITSGLQYSWNFGDPTSPANTSQLASPTHVFTSGGVYTVTLTVTNVATGCRSTTTTQVTVTGLGNDFADVFKLGASPNPFAGETKIKYVLPENANSVTVEVYDMLGRKVSDIKHNEYAVAGEYVINYKNEDVQASSGVYMIRLTVDGNVAYIRVVDIAKQ